MKAGVGRQQEGKTAGARSVAGEIAQGNCPILTARVLQAAGEKRGGKRGREGGKNMNSSVITV